MLPPKPCHFRVHVDVAGLQRGGTLEGRFAYQLRFPVRLADQASEGPRAKGDEHVAGVILLPINAPREWAQLERLGEAILARETRGDAQLCRTVEISIPRGVPDRLALPLAAYAVQPLVDAGMVVAIDLHRRTARDGLSELHVHAVVTMRSIVGGTFGLKDRSWNRLLGSAGLRQFRGQVAARLAAGAAILGISIVLDPRSNTDRGLPAPPARGEARGKQTPRPSDRPASTIPPWEPTDCLVLHAATSSFRRLKLSERLARVVRFARARAGVALVKSNIIVADGGVLRLTDGSITIETTTAGAILVAGDLASALGWTTVAISGPAADLDDLLVALYSREHPVGVVNQAASEAVLLRLGEICKERVRKDLSSLDPSGTLVEMLNVPLRVAKAADRKPVEATAVPAQIRVVRRPWLPSLLIASLGSGGDQVRLPGAIGEAPVHGDFDLHDGEAAEAGLGGTSSTGSFPAPSVVQPNKDRASPLSRLKRRRPWSPEQLRIALGAGSDRSSPRPDPIRLNGQAINRLRAQTAAARDGVVDTGKIVQTSPAIQPELPASAAFPFDMDDMPRPAGPSRPKEDKTEVDRLLARRDARLSEIGQDVDRVAAESGVSSTRTLKRP